MARSRPPRKGLPPLTRRADRLWRGIRRPGVAKPSIGSSSCTTVACKPLLQLFVPGTSSPRSVTVASVGGLGASLESRPELDAHEDVATDTKRLLQSVRLASVPRWWEGGGVAATSPCDREKRLSEGGEQAA